MRPQRAAGALVAAGWLTTRVLMAAVWWYRCQYIAADVSYYFAQLHQNLRPPLSEYPTPILWLMRLIDLAAGGNQTAFIDLVVALMVALDAAVTVALFLRASAVAAGFWVVFLALLGPILWFRIDLIPAACVTLALLWLKQKPVISGSMLAIGAATKLWPALLILPLLGKGRAARHRLAGFVVTGAVTALASLVVNGWARSVSPITWQTDRGLQIESLWATWPMIRHAIDPGICIVQMSKYNAYQVYGPGVTTGMSAASLMMDIAFVFAAVVTGMLVLWPMVLAPLLRRWRHTAAPAVSGRHGYAMLLSATAIILTMIAANKTFSPQYLIWLAGPLGLILARAKTVGERRAAVWVAVLGCTAAGLTQSEFPLNYGGLVSDLSGDVGVTSILVARNLLIACLTVLLMVWALIAAWRTIRPSRRQVRQLAHQAAARRAAHHPAAHPPVAHPAVARPEVAKPIDQSDTFDPRLETASVSPGQMLDRCGILD